MAAPVIDETQFPPEISEGAVGGPMFSTVVMVSDPGTEQRIAKWSVGRHKWTISTGQRTPQQSRDLKAFFVVHKGRKVGFRYKDWDDFEATQENLFPTDGPNTLGHPTAQLVKTYSFGPLSYIRAIYKPTVSPAATFRKNGGALSASLVTSTGIVTFTALITKTITAITKAASAIVTVGASHGFVINDLVYLSGVGGMTEINSLVGTVTAIGASTITVNINSTSFSTFTSGGTARKFAAVGDTFDWTGQFDVPVRFDVDHMQMTQTSSFSRDWENIPIVELRDSTDA